MVELGPRPAVPALPKVCAASLLLGEGARKDRGSAWIGEGESLSCGPWPGTTLPRVWLSEDMWLPSACSPVPGPGKVSIYTLSSFSLPLSDIDNTVDTWANPPPTLSFLTQPPTVWPPAKMTSLIPRETLCYLGKLEHSCGEAADFILEVSQGWEGP